MSGAVNYLKFLITGDDSQLDATLRKSKRSVTGYADDIASSMGGLGAAIGGVLAGISVAGFVGKLVSVQREFDVLNSSLKTVTGSSAAAEREMIWLKDFAKSTPFGLAQATEGFVKMKALGLDPTRAALNSLGNTASAMGKDLNQMIEAVADASTGEFERLKEFGIKASKEGNKVSFTFQGVTTTVRNNSAQITKYLENIGNTTFGGAMAERAKTLDGIIAGLGDTWDELFRTINSQQAGSLIFDSVTLANGVLEDAIILLRAMGGASTDTARDAGTLAGMQGGVSTFFETVAVMAAETLYVLRQTGDTLGGLAAGYQAFFSFDFDAVRAIGAAMKENGEAARRELDATTSRIMNARKEQALYESYATRNASAATDPRRVDLGGKRKASEGADKDTKGQKAAENAYKSLKKSVDDYVVSLKLEAEQGSKISAAQKLQIQLDGLVASTRGKANAKTVAGIQAAIAIAQALEDEAIAAKRAVSAYQAYLEIQEELNADYVEQSKAREQGRKSVDDYNAGIRESGEALQLELSMMGLSEQARGIAIEQYRIELELKKQIAAVNANTGFNQSQRDEMIASLQAGAATAKAQTSSKVFLDEWRSSVAQYDSIFGQGFADMLNAGEAGWNSFNKSLVTTFKTSVADQIYKMLLKPFVVNVVGNLMGETAGVASSGGNALGTAQSVQSLWSSFSGGLTSSLGSSIAGLGAQLGSTAATAFGSGIAAGGQLGLFGGGIGQGMSLIGSGAAGSTAAGLGTMAGAALPWVAGAAALYSIIKSFDDSNTPHSGMNARWSAKGGVYKSGEYSEFTALGLGQQWHSEQAKAVGDAVGGLAQTLGTSLDAFALAFGNKAGYVIETGFADDSSKDRSWGGLRIVDGAGSELVNWNNDRENRWAPRTFSDGEAGYKEYVNEVVMEVKGALQVLDMPGWAGQILKTATDIDTLNAALQQIGAVKAVFEGLGKTMGMFADLSGDAQTRFLAASGSVDALASNVGAFYQGFYSEQERAQKQREQQMAALGGMGLYIDPFQGNAANEMFRLTVEEALRSGQIELAANLMAMSVPFKEMTDYGQKLLEETADKARAVVEERAGLEQQLMQLQGDTLGLRALERDALDETNRALYDQINALTDAAQASQERAGLEQQLMQLQGDTLGLRALERAALDETNRALYDQVNALNDAKEAAEAAAQAAQGLAQGYASQMSAAHSAMDAAGALWDRLDAAQGGGGTGYAGIREQRLWAAMSEADYRQQIDLAGQLTDIVLNRHQLEQTNAQKLLDFGKSLRSYVDSLKIGALSPLTTSEKLAEAAKQWADTLAKADAGDETARGELQGISSSYLDLARQYYASSGDYTKIFNSVTGSLDALGVSSQSEAQQQLSVSSQSLEQLRELQGILWDAYGQAESEFAVEKDLLQRQVNEMLRTADGIEAVRELLGGMPAELAAQLNGGAATGTGSFATLAQSYVSLLGGVGGSSTDTRYVASAMGHMDSANWKSELSNALGLLTDPGARAQMQAIFDAVARMKGIDGSHANGLGYVPFDNYIAQLHKGERVLTAEENRAYTPNWSSYGMGSGVEALVSEVKALRTEVAQLRKENREDSQMQARANVGSNAANAVEVVNGFGLAAAKAAHAEKIKGVLR